MISSSTAQVIEQASGMSRREALKVMGLTGGAAMMMGAPTSAEAGPSSDKQVKVLIVGAGAGGIMALARLRRGLPNAQFTIIAPNEVHLYQPGQVFLAAGLEKHEELIKPNSDFIDEEVNWIKDEVASFDPDNNKVVTRNGEEVHYDYMVVATGIVYHYDWIEGLSESDIGTNGISSVYLSDLEKGTTRGAEVTWEWFKALKEAAKKEEKPTAIYTQPATPIKCGGAPQKILYLSADYLKEEGLEANYIFATNGSKLFSLPSIEKTLAETQKSYDTITNKFRAPLKIHSSHQPTSVKFVKTPFFSTVIHHSP